jgi:hypothetical protein
MHGTAFKKMVDSDLHQAKPFTQLSLQDNEIIDHINISVDIAKSRVRGLIFGT